MKLLALLLCFLVASPFANGADRKKDNKKKKKGQPTAVVADSTKQQPKGIPSLADFIKPAAKRHAGMVNIYEQNDRYFMEVPDKLLGRDLLVFVSLIRGSAQENRSSRDMYGFGGDALFNKVIRFDKGGKDKLFLQEPIFSTVMPDSTSEMYGALQASNMTPIVEGFDVKAKTDTSVLVDITDMYKSDHSYFSLKGASNMLNLGAYQADKSYPTTVSTYANNVIFRSVRSYAAGKPPKAAAGQKAQTLNPTTWEVAASWYLLPEEPMQPRYYDDRVGYFAYGQTDYTRDPLKAEKISMVSRWRLEPKDVEAYKRGELVEPVKPIVFYVDRNTPEYLQPYVIEAVNAWQSAFERIGFKNAIIGKLAPTPEEDSTFSVEDARYSFISYKASPMPNAYGPHVADPRSGEIICSHVGLFHNVLSLVQSWYFAQTAAANPIARQFPYSEELMGELVRYIVCHEIGHTLGLRHNFASSWTCSVEDIRNRDYVKEHGHTPSLMDYARFNYVAQPGDNIDPDDLIPRIGDYDNFAIEWGYRYLPQFKNAREEQKYLQDWVTAQRKANPQLFFGTETDKQDPRFQSEDLSSDAIAANTLGMKNLEVIMDSLMAWTGPADDEKYTLMKNMYNAVLGQHLRYLTHAIKYIGGRYTNAALRSEGMDNYEPVEKEKQEAAMTFLKKYFFSELPWLYNCEASHLFGQPSIDRYRERVFGKFLAQLLTSLQYISKNEAMLGNETYTCKEATDDMYEAVWGSLATSKPLTPFERMMQRNYLSGICIIVESGPMEVIPEFLALYTAQMDRIVADAKKKMARTNDFVTKNHLQGIIHRVETCLNGEETASK